MVTGRFFGGAVTRAAAGQSGCQARVLETRDDRCVAEGRARTASSKVEAGTLEDQAVLLSMLEITGTSYGCTVNGSIPLAGTADTQKMATRAPSAPLSLSFRHSLPDHGGGLSQPMHRGEVGRGQPAVM